MQFISHFRHKDELMKITKGFARRFPFLFLNFLRLAGHFEYSLSVGRVGVV